MGKSSIKSLIDGYESNETTCDGIDSDCDGNIDEALTGPIADRQAGVCAGTRKVCDGQGGWVEPDTNSEMALSQLKLDAMESTPTVMDASTNYSIHLLPPIKQDSGWGSQGLSRRSWMA